LPLSTYEDSKIFEFNKRWFDLVEEIKDRENIGGEEFLYRYLEMYIRISVDTSAMLTLASTWFFT